MEKLERKKRYKLKGSVITIICCVLCLGIGLFVGTKIVEPSHNENVESNELLEQIVWILEDKWVDTTNSKVSLQDRMINGLVNNLGDAYTNYMSLDQMNDFVQTINGNFVGIGVSFFAIDDGGLITDVYKDTPAYLGGLKAGDILYKANNVALAGLSSDEIKENVVGKEGTQVKVTVLRDNKELTFDLVRKEVEIDVEYEIKDNYGYLNIITFGENTAERVKNILKEFKDKKVENIIIDVRDNTGGYLNAVEDILNLFIPNNQIMFKMQGKSGEVVEYKANNDYIYEFNKGYILMNGETASSSEVMIGALTEILEYKTIGTQSFGKGIAQTTATLSNGSTLKYTNAKWLTPSGKCIHEEGFTPDFKVEEDVINHYAYREFDGEYKYDSVSVDVSLMQKMLKKLGYDIDREDGYFSLKTEKALKAFQKEKNIKDNGIYTFDIAKKLYASIAVKIYQDREDIVLDKAIELLK